MLLPSLTDRISGVEDLIAADVVRRARDRAESSSRMPDQARVDDAVRALAWSLYKPENARELAELAVEDTGLGNVPDKIIKKQRKTFGTLRDLLRAGPSVIIEQDHDKGIVKYAKPMGVVGAGDALDQSGRHPGQQGDDGDEGPQRGRSLRRRRSATAPRPGPSNICAQALDRIGLPRDLVQILPEPVTKDTTQAMMEAVDLVVVTGSQDNVRRAYRSGTPAIGVGAGNVPVIIDETADLAAAAQKICASKIFDNATSCSSENAVVIVDEVYDAAIDALKQAGGYLSMASRSARVAERLCGRTASSIAI